MDKGLNSSINLRMTVYVAVFTALIIIGGYISVPIPVGPVPIVLADFFVMLTGLFLGFRYGLITVLLYVVLGVIGLPVFSSGGAGLVVLFGPTGGFIFGYILAVISISLISEKGNLSIIKNLTALIVGNILLYAIGVPWLKVVTKMSWSAAIVVGFIPFIIGIVIKIVVAVIIGQVVLPRFKENLVASQLKSEEY